ncbi:MAG: TIM barrel protein [Chitinophagaceae bacterium]
MFLGIGSYTFPWAVGADGFNDKGKLTAMSILHMAAASDIRYVQFGDNLPLHLFPQDALVLLKQKAGELGIRIETGTRGLTKKNILQYLNIAEHMQSPFLRIVIDDGLFEPGVAEVTATIKTVLPFLRDKNIQLAIENHDRFPAAVLEQIILATDTDYVAICLDTANSIGSGESIRETVSILAPYTVNLHLKDILIKRAEHKMGFIVEGIAAGDGMLDIPWIINQLLPYNKCKTAILECWSNPEATMEATLVKEKQFAGKSIEYLKTILL